MRKKKCSERTDKKMFPFIFFLFLFMYLSICLSAYISICLSHGKVVWTLIDTKLNIVELWLSSALSIPAVKNIMGSV